MRFRFVDFHTPAREEIWEEQGEKWRQIKRAGLFVEGRCADADCDAWNKLVVCNPVMQALTSGRGVTFVWSIASLGLEANAFCPCCGAAVVPEGLGFTNCFYRMEMDKLPQVLAWCEVDANHAVTWNEGNGCNARECSNVRVLIRERTQQQHRSPQQGDRQQYLPMPRLLDPCCICLENIQTLGRVTVKLAACTHRFHLDCICRWQFDQRSKLGYSSCPICRRMF